MDSSRSLEVSKTAPIEGEEEERKKGEKAGGADEKMKRKGKMCERRKKENVS